jgi:nucleoside-diphosphate-sugar epimerase
MKPFTKKPPLIDNSKLVEIRQSRWVVSTLKAERVLGFQPAIKTRDAIDETARWYKEQGWL